jgi:hypothetical protein
VHRILIVVAGAVLASGLLASRGLASPTGSITVGPRISTGQLTAQFPATSDLSDPTAGNTHSSGGPLNVAAVLLPMTHQTFVHLLRSTSPRIVAARSATISRAGGQGRYWWWSSQPRRTRGASSQGGAGAAVSQTGRRSPQLAWQRQKPFR